MHGKEKLYFLLERINDAIALAPSGRPILIHPADDLNKKYTDLELMQLFSKLEQDEKVIRIIKTPSDPSIFEEPSKNLDAGCYAIEILEEFDNYYAIIQNEPEYREFTGKVSGNRNSFKEILKKQESVQALRPINFTPRSVLPVNITADEVIKNFSPGNYHFVLSVIEVILSLTDFSPDGKIAYQLQYPPGQSLINERRLLDRLSQMGLLSHYGEDGVFGIVTLGNINIEVLREVEARLSATYSQSKNEPSNVVNNSTADDELGKIETWVKNKNDWTRKKIWQVVSALYSEWQLRDKDIFKIPHDKFRKERISNMGDLEAILSAIHRKKIIFVSRKVAEQPSSNDPNKPGGMQLWQPITEDPDMVRWGDTQVEIFPKRFTNLYETLKQLVTNLKPDDLSGSSESLELESSPKENVPIDLVEKYVCGGLQVNVSRATIQFNKNPSVDIQSGNKEIKFLITLIKNQESVVTYEKIADEIESTSSGSETPSRAVQYLMRDLKPILKECGMSEEEIKKMFLTDRKHGYKIKAI